MSTRGKRKRPAKAAAPTVPEPWPPSAVAEAFRLAADSWMCEPEPVDDPEARAELVRQRRAVVTFYADHRAKQLGGRKNGPDREAAARIREHIIALRAEYPKAQSKELRGHADPNIVPTKMPAGTWDNLVSKYAPPKSRTR